MGALVARRQLLMSAMSIVEEDQYWPYVTTLLHFNGVQNSSNFRDETGKVWVPAATGSAYIDTLQSRFGGGAIYFDGIGDYIFTPDSEDWDLPGDFTIELWVRFNALPVNNTATLVSTYLNATTGWALQFRNDAGTPRLRFGWGDSVFVDKNWTPSVGVWYHMAVCRSGTVLRHFIDGVQLGADTTFTNSLSGSTNPLWLGALWFNGAIQNFTGWIDEFRITKGIARYVGSFTPPQKAFGTGAYDPFWKSIISLLRFDGAEGSTAVVDKAAARWAIAGTARITKTKSQFGGSSLDTSAAGAYIASEAGGSLSLGGGDYTIEGWINISAIAGWYQCLFDNRTSGNAGISLYIADSASRTYFMAYNNSAMIATSAPMQISTGVMHHWACTRQGTTVRGFIDGVLVFTGVDSRVLYGAPRMTLGNESGGTQPVRAYIDDFCVTKGVARYTGNFIPPIAPYVLPADRTVSLVHFNSPNLLLDSKGIAWGIETGTVTESADAKFGGSSARLVNATIQSAADIGNEFGRADFTIEFFIKLSNANIQENIWGCGVHAVTGTLIQIYKINTNYIFWGLGGGNRIVATGAAQANVWQHIALTRENGVFRFFIGGVLYGSLALSFDLYGGRCGFGSGSVPIVDAKLQEYRAVKGRAIYTANFTPPTAPFE